MDARAAVRRRLAAFFAAGGDVSLVTEPDAVHDARQVLTGALRVDGDGDVVVEAQALELGAWLFWCRWQMAPTDSDDPDAQTAYRMFAVLRAVDPDVQVPPDIAASMADPDNDQPVADWLHYEARDLIDGCLHRFDDVAVDLGVELAKCAVATAVEGSAEQAEYAVNLGAGLFSRYLHRGSERDLDEAVDCFRTAEASGYGDPSERARYLANLGVALHTRFERAGRAEDLVDAVRVHRRALHARPGERRYLAQYAAVLHTRYEHEGRPRDLNRAIRYTDSSEPLAATNRANMLRDRYERGGELADLDEATWLLEDVVRDTPPDDPDRSRRLSSLASARLMRFASTDDLADLDGAIRYNREAVATARPDDPRRLDYLSNLGHALHDRYEETGDLADLDSAVATYAQARERPGRPDAVRVANEANAYAARFDHLSEIADLDRALDTYIAALEALPPRHIHRGSHLSNLGSLWFVRFNRTDDLDDLTRSIDNDRAAIRATPPGHRDLSRRLANLGASLDSMYESTGAPSILDEAIAGHRAAYRAAPESRRRHHGAALGIALHLRYQLRGRADDLDDAIALHREAVDCRPEHRDRPRRQSLLASTLMTRSADRGRAADLDEAVDLLRDAAANTPERHVQRVGREMMLGGAMVRLAERTDDLDLLDEGLTLLRTNARRPDASSPPSYRLRTLGDGFEARWHLTGEVPDLREAIAAYRSAIALARDDEPEQALNRYNLAGVLAALADATGGPAAQREALAEYRTAATQVTAPVPLRIYAAGEWAALLLATDDPGGAADGFAFVLDLLPQLAWLGLARPDQERMLADWRTLAPDAAAAALLAGRVRLAVELADQGRSLLWEQQLRLRDTATELDRRHPRLADRLRRIRLELTAAGPSRA